MRVRAGWAITVLLIAALEFAVSYRGVAAPLALVLACVVPFGLVAAGRRLKLGTFTPALLSIVLAVVGAWLVLRGSGSLGDAVPRLLTTARPADSSAGLLAPVAVLVVLVAAVVAAFVIGGESLLAPVAGAAVLYTAAQLLAAGDSDPHGIVAACLLVVVVGGWSHPYLRGRTGLAWRPAAVVPVVVVAVLALGTATLVTSDPFDPRRHVTPPTVRLSEDSPLVQLRTWTANPTVRILRAKVTGTARLHLATLDTFTGAAWEVDSRYQQVGLTTFGDLPAGTRQTRARATVRLERLGGVWLPAPGVTTGSSLDDVLIDPDDGTLAGPGQVRPGLTYDVEADVAAPTDTQLAVAAVPRTVPQHYLALPNGPVAFAQYARAAVRGASTPLEEALALESAVSTGRTVDAKAPSGSSYGRLSNFLFGARGVAGTNVGTAEQFAAAFAVLAREVGLPTRLTVGFDLGEPGADGSVLVRGRDASVWPEVYLTGAGWVAFSPTPGADGDGGNGRLRDDVLQRLADRVRNLPPPPPPASVAPTPPAASFVPGKVAADDRARVTDAGLPGWVIALIVLAAVVLLVIATLLGLRTLRSRRHRRAGARGAWAEVVDLLILLGRRPAADRPAPEIAGDVADVLGEHAATIAAAADRAAFAPDSSSSPAVWKDVRRIQRRARTTVPRYRRVLLPVDPRPLLTRRR